MSPAATPLHPSNSSAHLYPLHIPPFRAQPIHEGDCLAPLLLHDQNLHERRIVSVSTIRITKRISNLVHFPIRILQPLLRLSSEYKQIYYYPGCVCIAVVSALKKLVGIGSPAEYHDEPVS